MHQHYTSKNKIFRKAEIPKEKFMESSHLNFRKIVRVHMYTNTFTIDARAFLIIISKRYELHILNNNVFNKLEI